MHTAILTAAYEGKGLTVIESNLMKTALGAFAALTLFSLQAEAGGKIHLINETDAVVHPWFKSTCWGAGIGTQTGWVFFGTVGARSQFEWDFTDPALTDPACPNPRIQFTFTSDATPPPDKVDEDSRARFKFAVDKNEVIQIGERLQAFRLGKDNENSDDD